MTIMQHVPTDPHTPSGTWESLGYFPVWVFYKEKDNQGNFGPKKASLRHVVIDPAFCMPR